MIQFIQPNEVYEGDFTLPSEALIINGESIEDLIWGYQTSNFDSYDYQTLSVQGRELMGQEVTLEGRVGGHGSIQLRNNYPERYITVQYKLRAENRSQFRKYFEIINSALTGEDHELRFFDDMGYYFIGTLESVDSVPTGSNSVVSSFTFVCKDPFKYSDIKIAKGKNPNVQINDAYDVLPTKIKIETIANGGKIELKIVSAGISDDKTISIPNLTINSYDVIEFDFEKFTITRNGVSILDSMDLSSDFENFYIESYVPIYVYPESNVEVYYREVEL